MGIAMGAEAKQFVLLINFSLGVLTRMACQEPIGQSKLAPSIWLSKRFWYGGQV